MNKIQTLSFFAAALMTLAGCSSDGTSANADITPTPATNQVPVAFGTYLGTSTRAGKTGDMTKDVLASEGFGVFGYYTGVKTYQDFRTTSAKPDFMYNTQVKGTTTDGTTSWSYSPLRYWPNPMNNNDEILNQHVSFFAYAPYVSAGAGNYGITALPANNKVGDPILTYDTTPATDGKIVDLLWGTANNSGHIATGDGYQENTSDEDNNGKAYDATSEITDGTGTKVNADLSKQTISGQVKFLFKHALAKFGGYSADPTTGANKSGVTIDLIADAVSGTSADIDLNTTRVVIDYITIEAKKAPDTDGGDATDLATSGKFNLVTGTWDLTDATTKAYSQKIAGSQNSDISAGVTATTTATMNSTLASPVMTSAMMNSDSTAWSSSMPEGVTTTAKNIYANDGEGDILVLPGQKPQFVITISYHVYTLDKTLALGYAMVHNLVKKTVTFDEAFDVNKKYNLAIHLGLTSVKFDATVEDWTNTNTTSGSGTTTTETVPVTVNMPVNVAE